MRILCTGGKGFLGSRLAVELESRGHDVRAIDRADGDLSIITTADRLIKDADMVVHLAAQPGRVLCESYPTSTIADNVTGTLCVAQACARYKARLCYISTSEVYADGVVGRRCLDMKGRWVEEEIVRPRNLYALTKWYGEQISALYAPKGLLIIRPSMTYGPGMKTGYGRAALPTMIDHFLRGQPYIVHRDTYRSWCYVDDMIRGMADVIERGEGTYNVGREDDLFSMEDLAGIVCAYLGTDSDLIVLGDADESITKIKDISMDRLRSLGWDPQVSISEGIKRTAEALKCV